MVALQVETRHPINPSMVRIPICRLPSIATAADQMNPCKTETGYWPLSSASWLSSTVAHTPTSMPFRPLMAWLRTCRIRRQPLVALCSLIMDLSLAPDLRPIPIMKQRKGPVKLRQIVRSICISILR